MPGARCTHSLACKMKTSIRVSHHRFAEIPGLPCAMVLTVSFVLSPVTGLFCHRRLRIFIRKLDASVGASGPHDFAVRISAARLASPKRPPHPAPNVRDDRDTPLSRGRDSAKDGADLGFGAMPPACGTMARRANYA